MLFGILLLALGLIIILTQLFNQSFWTFFGLYWPVLVVIYGVYRLFSKKGSRVLSAAIIVSGILFQLQKLGYIQGSAFVILLAMGLVLIGIKIIVDDQQEKEAFRNRQAQAFSKTKVKNEEDGAENRTRSSQNEEDSFVGEEENTDPGHRRQVDSHSKQANFFENKDVLNDRFIFTNDTKVYRSDTFSGGQVEASFSDVTLDLKNVWPLDSEIFMDIQINFSSVTLQLPADWHVIVNNKHFYSAKELKDQVEPETTLIIHSREFMGSLKII